MSYDLYFYKRKEHKLYENQIANYLSDNLITPEKGMKQWFYENEDTEVYFSFDHNEPETDPEGIELYESFKEFDSIHFSFNLNFIRPNFFGLEAFQFVVKFINEFDLFILNPQSSGNSEIPTKYTINELHENWSTTNLRISSDSFNEYGLFYYPIEKSDEIWNYNFNRKSIQDRLGKIYFVPKVFYMKLKNEDKIVTASTWTHHIPNVFPNADYYLLNRQYSKMLKQINDSIIITYEKLINVFGKYMKDFEFKNCKIIHPFNAKKVNKIFNKVKFDYEFEDFFERISMDQLVNVGPK